MISIWQGQFENKRELERKEREFIELLHASLNRLIPTRTDRERRIDDRERISQRKQFRQNNKQLIAEQRKQYRQKNKEVISQIGKQTTDCRCGAIVRVDSHTRHNRTQKHQFYVNLLDYINS